MILIPVFLVLFASWVLWGWIVGETKDIKLLRNWCAPIFVGILVMITAGGAAIVSRHIARNEVRRDVSELLDTIQLRIRTGGATDVIEELRTADHSDDPDRDAFDLLDHVAVMNENLSPGQNSIPVASEESPQMR